MTTFTVEELPTDKCGIQAIPTIYNTCNNVFLVVARKKNGNVVVYEGVLDNKRNLKRIDIYWLDLEPSYRQKARKSGRRHDRSSLKKIDKLGYDMYVTKKITPQKWEIQFKVYKQKMIVMVSRGWCIPV